MSLDAQDVVLRRGGFRLGPLTFKLPVGCTLALIGPNGGGKTTLLKTLAGLLKPAAGLVRIDDEDIHRASSARRASLAAYLPPPGETDAAFTARHVAAMGRLRLRRWPADLVAEDFTSADSALERLGADGLAHRRFDQLSSGQRQLVLLARTLLQDARVILLDEPSATLDPARRLQVTSAVRTLADEGRTVVFSTHEPAEAARADLCLTVEQAPYLGSPEEALTPDRLARLYDAPASAFAR